MRRLHWLGVVALAACIPGGQGPDGSNVSQTALADLKGESRSVMPLVTLGDVNEDGVVDDNDAEELCDYVNSGGGLPLSCPAAADLDLDGQVTEKDHQLMREMVASGPVTKPSLYAQPTLPCSFKNLQFGATAVIEGQPTRIRLFRGLTTQSVKTAVTGPVELVPEQDGKGFIVSGMETVAPGASISVAITAGTIERFLTFTRAVVSTVDYGDGHYDDGGVPTYGLDGGVDIYGHDDEVCPFINDGCQVLSIDFTKNVDTESHSTNSENAFSAAGCNVISVAPTMLRPPEPRTVADADGGSHVVQPDPEAVAIVADHNRAQWSKVTDAIRKHRALVAGGADLAVQIVNGHGDGEDGCGSFGTSFYTGVGELYRASFHAANYAAENHSVCHASAMDWTCYGGLTVKAVQSLDNTGAASCAAAPPINHAFHSGFLSDSAMSLAPAADVCFDDQVGDEDKALSDMVNKAMKDFNQIASGIRGRLPGPTVMASPFQGYYADKGYNHAPGLECTPADHVSAF
jgi:hypothetical protein